MQPPKQTDAEAANSATPDTDRLPSWDDPDWDSYLWATDWQYRVDYYMEHGDTEAAQDEVDEHRQRSIEAGDWSEDDEEEYIAGGWADYIVGVWADDDEE